MSQRRGSPSEGTSATATKPSPITAPPLPPNTRRSSTPLPGLNTTASSIRNRLPSRSSLSKVSQANDDREDEEDDARMNPSMDPQQLAELKKGIIMPGMAATSATMQKAAAADSTNRPPANQTSVDATPRSRLPATLKASILKGRHQAALQTPASSGTNAPKSRANLAKGTPARATRYSLPVRGEKPVRTSKTSGKHVMLPSESQLAPLPDEEEDDEDEDDDDDDDSSESSESDEAKEEEEAAKVGEQDEDRLKSREEAKKRREEAQRSLEARREEKAAQKIAKKPAGAPGYPSSARFRGIPSTGRLHTLPPVKGPAHARAPPIKPKTSGPAYHTFERLAPSARVHTPLPRLTSYAISSSIHLPTLIGFLRREHSVRPRLYDECAYVVYFKPLLPGFGRAEVRSAPEPAGASGGESRREREIVEREESGYVGSYFAAANKDDEGDHIDEQGYIMGGEGEGEGQRSENRGRERQQDQGEMTETETEREGPSMREQVSKSNAAAEASESEAEAQVFSETEYEDKNYQSMPTTDASDDAESGLLTPRGLEPKQETDYFVEGEEQQLNEALDEYQGRSTVASGQEDISNADLEGAMDLQHQQHMIESGQVADGIYPSHRGSSEVHFEELENGQGNRRGSPENGSGSHRRHRDERRNRRDKETRRRRKPAGPNTASHDHDTSINKLTSRPIMEALQMAELIILPYGVLVMYNLSEAEERSIINDVISSGCVRGGLPYSPDDEETEAFHFCYDPTVPAPRIFNDFFTFRTSNHLLKLSLAHAIAQSTKLSVFEESMQRTLELTSHIPRELASSGQLKLKRREALMLTGRLFKLRVDVNLTSNVLDTPELFWSEASLKALYDAIREYLEIEQRVQNLNERLAVGNDLLEVIHDHIGSQAMDNKTVIIIYLIVVALLVALGEVLARLIVNSSREHKIDVMMRSNDFTSDPHFEIIKQLYYLSLNKGQASSQTALLLDG